MSNMDKQAAETLGAQEKWAVGISALAGALFCAWIAQQAPILIKEAKNRISAYTQTEIQNQKQQSAAEVLARAESLQEKELALPENLEGLAAESDARRIKDEELSERKELAPTQASGRKGWFASKVLGWPEDWKDLEPLDERFDIPLWEEKKIVFVAGKIAERWRISTVGSKRIVSGALLAAQKTGLEPELILAVAAVESSFNPFAQSNQGALGLMQVVPKYHPALAQNAGGEAGLMVPEKALEAGALALTGMIARARNREHALSLYNGEAAFGRKDYARLVLRHKAQIDAWSRFLDGARSAKSILTTKEKPRTMGVRMVLKRKMP